MKLRQAVACVDLDNMLSEKVREWKTLYVITYMWNLKNKMNECIAKQKKDIENQLMISRGQDIGMRLR